MSKKSEHLFPPFVMKANPILRLSHKTSTAISSMEEEPMICKHVSTMKGAIGMLRDADHVEMNDEGSDFISRKHAKGYVTNGRRR